VERRQIPPDLVKRIQQMSEELDQSIQAEQIRFGREVEKKVDVLAFYAKLSIQSPMDYYTNGKVAIVDREWIVAKDNFLKYQYFVEAHLSKKLPQGLGDIKLKDPHEDKHLEYLELIHNKMEGALPVDEELLIIWSKNPGANPYTQLKKEWRRQYPFTTSSSRSSSVSSTTSASASSTTSSSTLSK